MCTRLYLISNSELFLIVPSLVVRVPGRSVVRQRFTYSAFVYLYSYVSVLHSLCHFRPSPPDPVRDRHMAAKLRQETVTTWANSSRMASPRSYPPCRHGLDCWLRCHRTAIPSLPMFPPRPPISARPVTHTPPAPSSFHLVPSHPILFSSPLFPSVSALYYQHFTVHLYPSVPVPFFVPYLPRLQARPSFFSALRLPLLLCQASRPLSQPPATPPCFS